MEPKVPRNKLQSNLHKKQATKWEQRTSGTKGSTEQIAKQFVQKTSDQVGAAHEWNPKVPRNKLQSNLYKKQATKWEQRTSGTKGSTEQIAKQFAQKTSDQVGAALEWNQRFHGTNCKAICTKRLIYKLKQTMI